MKIRNHNLRIADYLVKVCFKDVAHEQFKLPAQYLPFEIPESNSSEEVLFELNVDDELRFDTLGEDIGHFHSNGNNQDIYLLPDGSYQFELGDYTGEVVCRMKSSADFTENTIGLIGGPSQYLEGFNNAMMIAFAFASALKGTLLMHSSTIMFENKGYMFLGKSGTGKSTHTSLWLKNFEGTELLNDDNPVIRIIDNQAIVYGTPWSGKTPCYKQKKVGVGALVMLEQKPYNKIEPQKTLQALGGLLISCATMIWDKKIHDSICNTLSAIIRLVPFYHLECLPDDAAAKLCKATVVK